MELLTDKIESPIGDILLAAGDGKLIALEFAQVRERFDADLRSRFGDCTLKNSRNPFGFSDRIRAYFAGELAALDDIPVDGGGTSFQRKVWAALREIPAGATKSYSELAEAVGRPNAVRAVGMINGRNPISIVVPCHRVIGKDGSLTGYGGGLDRKRWLLRHEGALSALLVVLALSAIAPRAVATEKKWSTAAPMPLARSELSATVVEDRLYVAGGIAQLGASPAFQVYDPSANSWRSLAPLPEPRHHFGMASLDGRIYVSGGYRDLPFGADQAHRETWSYDVARDRWSRTADLPVRRAAHAMVALGDRLYVVGGVGPEPGTVLVYDRQLDSWSRLPAPLPTPREHLAALALDGKLYVVGGRWSGQGNFGTVEIYDAATKVWSQATDMSTARGGLTAAVLGGRIHVAGGEDLDSGDTFPAHEVYDPAANHWSVEAPLPTSRHGLASGVIGDRWYVVGGGEQAGAMTFVSLSNVVEVFGP